MIISVASGKGGTGKTLIATNLALSIKDTVNVQLLDCDVEEPNDHIFLKPALTKKKNVTIPVPQIDEDKCTHCGKCSEVCAFKAIVDLKKMVLVFPELCHGCGACSYLCPEKAIIEEPRKVGVVEVGYASNIRFISGRLNVGEAMAPPVIRSVKEYINPEETVIIDVPPGTSCPVVESIKGSDFCLLVTEPTPFGLNDLELAVELIRKLDIPCGLVLNRADIGDANVEKYCINEGIPIMLIVPLDMNIARLYSRGIPLVKGMPDWRERFQRLFDSIQVFAKPTDSLVN